LLREVKFRDDGLFFMTTAVATKNIKRMTPEQKKARVAELLAMRDQLMDKSEQVKTANPFWYYKPNTGDIAPDRREFLRKHLKEEDIPQRLVGQLDAHKSTAQIRGFSGGNQSGKTTGGIIEVLIQITGAIPYALEPHYPKIRLESRPKGPQYWRIVSIDFDNGITKNILPALRFWAPKEYLLDGNFDKSYVAGARTLNLYDPQTRQLLGAIELMSNKQETEDFQGPPRNGVMYDEEPREDIRKENLLRFTTTGVNEIFCMTPTKGLSWTAEKLFGKSEHAGARIDWFKFPSVTNPKASIQSLTEIIKDLDTYDEIKMRLLGEFISLSGLVYGGLFSPQIHIIEPFNTSCTCKGADHTPDCPYSQYLGFLGIDCHYVKPSTALLGFVDAADNFIVDTCYKRGADVEELKQGFNRLIEGKRMNWAVFDPSNDSSITAFGGRNIFQMITRGTGRLKIRAFKGEKYSGSISAGVHTIKQRLKINPNTKKPTLFIMNRPENQELIRSFKTLQREAWANEDVRGQKDRIAEGVHDHHACLRYIMQNKVNFRPVFLRDPEPIVPDREAILL
jgi:phage terminase large subunit-like protein